jgi:sugar (pentulose or hexulose) kinase
MWDFSASRYAEWVYAEELAARQAEVKPSNSTVEIRHGNEIIYSGIGLHDSSAALIPYLAARSSPFCLISTGTWSITLNPFNHSPLTDRELAQDCLCYLSFEGTPVKAARLFSGHFHDTQAKILGDYFHKAESYYKSIERAGPEHDRKAKRRDISQPFVPFDAGTFSDYESAYLFLVEELVARQVQSTNLVITDQTNDIFVDGGFSNNVLFMTLLAKAYPNRKVYAANVPQASALGAAIAIHSSWNPAPIPKDLLKLKSYSR